MKSDCTVHYLLIFFLTILPILFLKERKKQKTHHKYIHVYISIYKARILFSCNEFWYILTAVEVYHDVVVWDLSLCCGDT